MTPLRFLTFLGVALIVGHVSAAEPPATAEEKLRVTAEVYRIFEAKCADCHGSHLPKPKGKFGYVLDLMRVGKNPKFIEPGNPKDSELFQMVKNNEMPGEDADVPPLTPEEKKTVERWVLIGAPGDLPTTLPAGQPPATAQKTVAATVPFFTRLLNWLGKFHPVSTHFPVALLLVAVLAEFFAWWMRRSEWTLFVRFLVVLGALSSIPTATLGWLANYPTVSGSQLALIYRIHQILGTATALWAIVCAVLICSAECEEGSIERKRFRGALLLGAALVSIVGFLGGVLAAGGLDHYKF